MTDGYYWIQTHRTSGWTIAKREMGTWEFFGTLQTLDDDEIGDHFRVGMKIEPALVQRVAT